ncbi:MAG: response regulator [Deltaproteobacteria bacterium]|nr:response regulator [Deltaproteobacteria bacterium]
MIRQKKIILIVDDSSTLRAILRRELTVDGYEIVEAKDGLEALALAEEHSPDLITLDVTMPEIDGFETCERLHQLSHNDLHTPVVFVTSQDNVEDRIKGFELGSAFFVGKPFEKGELLAVVDSILNPEPSELDINVLIVDDSRMGRHILSASLKKEGLNIIEAEGGTKALEILSAQRDLIDIVITDLIMPAMEGDELCQKIRKDLGMTDLPVIIITALENQSRLLGVFEAGANDYLIKPYVEEELLARINVHLERSQLSRHLRKTIDELKQTKEQADKASKAKGEFLANMSHEIGTPLSAVIDLTELALGNDPPQKILDYLKQIKVSSHALLDLINDILDSSKIDAERLEIQSPVPSLDGSAIEGKKPNIEVDHLAEARVLNSSASGFPESLPGFNVTKALSKLNGKKELYRKLLIQFSDSFANSAAELRDAMDKGTLQEGELLSHNIKGVAGNLCAVDLQAAAADLEHVFRQSHKGNFELLMDGFEECLNIVIASISGLEGPRDNNQE